MYIHGSFNDIHGQLITVEILSNDSSTQELVIGENGLYFGADPVVIDCDIENTFEPIIRHSATINLVTEDYIGDNLFANNSRTIKVNIFKEYKAGEVTTTKCVFAGFVEPGTFSQPFNYEVDEFSINCTDALSTLQYYNYDNVENTQTSYNAKKNSAANKTFLELLSGMLTPIRSLDISGSHTSDVLYDESKAISQLRTDTVFSDLGISELVLIGEDPDDIMTQEEVMKQMLQYLNLHIIQVGFDYYIFDWYTIKHGLDNWIGLLGSSDKDITPLTTVITSKMHSSANTNISIAEVYTQVQVKDDIQDQEDIIVSPLDDDELYSLYPSKQRYMTEYISEGEGSSAYNAFKAMIKGEYTDYDACKQVDWFYQVMSSKNWKFYWSAGQNPLNDGTLTYSDQWRVPYLMNVQSPTPAIIRFGSVEHKNQYQDDRPISKVDMSSYLIVSISGNENDVEGYQQPSDTVISTHGHLGAPMIEYTGTTSGGAYSPTDSSTTNYLVFSGKICLMPVQHETAMYEYLYQYFANQVGNEATAAFDSFYGVEAGMGYWHHTVPSDNNGDGRYYTRKFWTPTSDSDTSSYMTNWVSLHPWTKDKANHMLEYNYSAHGESQDTIRQLGVLECELIIGNKRLIQLQTENAKGFPEYQWVTLGSEPTVTYDGQTYTLKTFQIGINPIIGDKIIGDEFDITNNVDYTMNIDAEGTAIPITKADNLSGAVIFRILGPINSVWNDITRRHPTFFRHTKYYDNYKFVLSHVENIYIKEFECKIYSDAAGNEITEDNDLIYLSNENHTFINKKEDIEFKFITQLSSEECREKGIKATVNLNAVVNNQTGLPLTGIYNRAYQGSGETGKKPEEYYVDAYYTEYSEPKILLETDLKDDDKIAFNYLYHSAPLGKNFYVQSLGRNLKLDSAHIVLKQT